MKKTLLFVGLFSYSILFGALFEHNTDIPKNYEFDSDVRTENERLSKRLNSFKDAKATQDEIQENIELKASSTLYKQDVLIVYSEEQKKILKISDKDIEAMHKQEKKGWFASLFSFGDDSNKGDK